MIICKTYADATTVRDAIDPVKYLSINTHLNPNHLRPMYAPGHITLGTWESVEPIQVPDDYPVPVFVQKSEEADLVFLGRITAHFAEEVLKQKENAKRLMAAFPEFHYEEKSSLLSHSLDVKDKVEGEFTGRSFYVNLKDYDKGFDTLFYYWLHIKQQESLRKRWPYLVLNWREDWAHKRTPLLHSWVVEAHYFGKRHKDGAATGVKLRFPPTKEDAQVLDQLNAESKKCVEDRSLFFCTGCHKAVPKEQYAGFWFAEVLCKKCATPDWKEKARRESYD